MAFRMHWYALEAFPAQTKESITFRDVSMILLYRIRSSDDSSRMRIFSIISGSACRTSVIRCRQMELNRM
jgi:hypothetical protein